MKLIFFFFLYTCITGAHSRTLQGIQEDAFEGSKTNYARPSLSPPPSPDASPSERQVYPNTLIVMVTTNNDYENDINFDFNNKNKYEREIPVSPPAPGSSTPHHPLTGGGIERKAPSPPPAPKHGPPTHQVSSNGFERIARSPPPAPRGAPPTHQASRSGLVRSSASNQLVAST